MPKTQFHNLLLTDVKSVVIRPDSHTPSFIQLELRSGDGGLSTISMMGVAQRNDDGHHSISRPHVTVIDLLPLVVSSKQEAEETEAMTDGG